MNRRMVLAILIGFSLGLAACAPPPPPAPTETSTPVPPTLTPTVTPVWFPPTATFTPYPTPELLPTEDMRPGIGSIILEDDFSSEGDWTLGATDKGSVALGLNELTIAIAQEDVYLFGVREQPVLTNFYLEITASASFCRGLDEYGLLLRVSPSLDYYRFSLSCDGQVRLDRLYRGQASSPQTWLLSGAFLPGAPSISRLGVWAVGEELRFFINDTFQFSVRDPLLTSGGVGVFARSTSDMPVTVNFTDLVVYSVEGR